MIICKEIAEYLRYAEEHPKRINKEVKLLIENIVSPTLRRDDVFFDDKTYQNCLKYCEKHYYKLFPYQKFIYAFAFMYKEDIPIFPKFFISSISFTISISSFEYNFIFSSKIIFILTFLPFNILHSIVLIFILSILL